MLDRLLRRRVELHNWSLMVLIRITKAPYLTDFNDIRIEFLY